MENLTSSAIALIKRIFGLTDDQITKSGPFLGGIISYEDDGKTWAQKQYEKDTKEWKKIRDL
jgi:hypothetical protein